MMTEVELLELKQKIDENKVKLAGLNGQVKIHMETLKKEWQCATLEEAEKKIEEIDKKIETLSSSIETKTKELEAKYIKAETDDDN